jgi:hypothetical protein
VATNYPGIGRHDVRNVLRFDVDGPQPWPKEQLDVPAPGRGLETRLHFLVGDNQECRRLSDLESVHEIGSLPYLDAVDHEGLVVAIALKHLSQEPLRAT